MATSFQRNSTEVKIITTALVMAGLIAAQAKRVVGATKPSHHRYAATEQGTADFLNQELKTLVNDFGISANNIPQDFVEKVHRWARLYRTRDRDEMERVLWTSRKDFETVQRKVASANLHPDLAFVTLVESHFQAGAISRTDNAGLWQFTRNTARLNGLKVNSTVDERLNPHKSTEAACRYLWQLQRHLGPDSSIMLTIAAYNMGPGRLKQRMSQVKDPLNRRDFWHLYQARILPALTRTHLARLVAAIIIGRHPEHFGFKIKTPSTISTISSVTLPGTRSVSR